MSRREDNGQFLRRYWRPILAGVVICGIFGLVAVNLLVETEQDRVEEVINQLEEALEAGDARAVVRNVAPDYLHQGLDRDAIRRLAQSAFRRYGAPWIAVLNSDYNVQRGLATCEVYLLAGGDGPGGRLRNTTRSEWRLSLVERGDRWYITKITPLVFNGNRIRDMRELTSHFAGRLWRGNAAP